MPWNRVYVDPYNLFGRWPEATIILITHPHYDHLDRQSIRKITSRSTKLLCPESINHEKIPLPPRRIVKLPPLASYSVKGHPISIRTYPAYNIDGGFHKRDQNWLGYVLETRHSRFFHAGDTGPLDLDLQTEVNLGFFPVDGIYTMDPITASNWADSLPVTHASPIHFGTERGTVSDALQFRRRLKATEPVFLEAVRLQV